MRKLKVAIIMSNHQYDQMFKDEGWGLIDEKDFHLADLVQFTGGSDVSPDMYGEKVAPRTWVSETRDVKEKAIFDTCAKMEIPMAGICRGGQFLNVMNGGRMLQHVEGHTKAHIMQDIFDEWAWVSSTHHQMMLRHPDGLLVAWALEGHPKFSFFHGEYREVDEELDTEVVFYEKTRSLCFQPHAEFTGSEYDSLAGLYFSYLEEFLKPGKPF